MLRSSFTAETFASAMQIVVNQEFQTYSNTGFFSSKIRPKYVPDTRANLTCSRRGNEIIHVRVVYKRNGALFGPDESDWLGTQVSGTLCYSSRVDKAAG